MKNALSIIGILMVCATLTSGQTSLGKESLKGLTSVGVVVEDFNPELVKDGIDKDQIQQDVELRLRKAGIKVVSLSTALRPYLHVLMASTRIGNTRTHAFSIKVSLRQSVTLQGKPSIKLYADTWSGNLTIAATSDLREIRRTLDDCVDTFVNDHLAENTR